MFNRHFRDFIALLERNEVKFVVVGGCAVGLHGFPRYTGDLEIFIAVDPQNAERVTQSLADFGFTDLAVTPADFLAPDTVIEIGREPMKIQILTGIDGVTFDQCYAARRIAKFDGLDVPFIGYKELLKNKAASPRGKDKIDLEELKKIPPPSAGT